VDFEPAIPAIKHHQTYAFDRTATDIGINFIRLLKQELKIWTGHVACMEVTRFLALFWLENLN
jgi:hypothetical protein